MLFGVKVYFHQLGPLGRVGLIVAKSVCSLFLCLSLSHAIFLHGRTGADRAWSVDWCDLNLEPSPKNKEVFRSSISISISISSRALKMKMRSGVRS